MFQDRMFNIEGERFCSQKEEERRETEWCEMIYRHCLTRFDRIKTRVHLICYYYFLKIANNLPGRSEKRRIHSLNPDSSNTERSCCKIEKPINSGNDALPSNNASHKFRIFWIGKTSEKKIIWVEVTQSILNNIAHKCATAVKRWFSGIKHQESFQKPCSIMHVETKTLAGQDSSR